MARRVLINRSRTTHGRKFVYWAYLTAVGLLCGDALPTNGHEHIRLPLAPSFEEDSSAAAPMPYVWRNAQVVVGFGRGAVVSLHAEDRTDRRISFAGADPAAAPKGESGLGRQTSYYIGDPKNWHVDNHFERIRYA